LGILIAHVLAADFEDDEDAEEQKSAAATADVASRAPSTALPAGNDAANVFVQVGSWRVIARSCNGLSSLLLAFYIKEPEVVLPAEGMLSAVGSHWCFTAPPHHITLNIVLGMAYTRQTCPLRAVCSSAVLVALQLMSVCSQIINLMSIYNKPDCCKVFPKSAAWQ